MLALNYENESVELNENEAKVYSCFLLGGDEFEERWSIHASDVFVEDLTKNQIKGYLSSLQEKEVLTTAELPNGDHCWLTTATIENLEESK